MEPKLNIDRSVLQKKRPEELEEDGWKKVEDLNDLVDIYRKGDDFLFVSEIDEGKYRNFILSDRYDFHR